MSLSRTRLVLLVALIATLLAAYFAPSEDGHAVELSARTRAAEVKIAAGAKPEGARISGIDMPAVAQIEDRSPLDEDLASWDVLGPGGGSTTPPLLPKAGGGPNTALSGAVSKAPAQEPDSPAPAVPPVLPFKVLGRAQQDGQDSVFLQFREQNLVVKAGDQIGDLYRVDSLDQTAMTLVYLPMGVVQTLDIGGAN